MESPQDVSLLVEGEVFTANKAVLSKHSDYFRAMFSGNFVENEQKEIVIDVIDASSMKLIFKYMETSSLDMKEYPYATIGEIALAANFLQMAELIKQITDWLELKISLTDWLEVMVIAENAFYPKLEQSATTYGLFNFKKMPQETIPTIQKLFWYLSHPHLYTDSELNAFKFGVKWITCNEAGADALIIILGCLDMSRLTSVELIEMQKIASDYANSLPQKIIDCLYTLSTDFELSVEAVIENKMLLCVTFTERVYTEVLNLVKESPRRNLQFTAAVPIWLEEEKKSNLSTQHLYTFKPEEGFKKWLEVADRNIWGWTVAAWGPTKIVLVGGEYGKGTGDFENGVRVYDIYEETWIRHRVLLPGRRHSGVAIDGDIMYIVGGVGGFRVVIDTTTIYNLNNRTHDEVRCFPETIQNPGVCTFHGVLYACGNKHVYKYDDTGVTACWTKVLETDIRANLMTPFRGYIYLSQNYFPTLYRFRPGIDTKLESIAKFTNSAAAICNVGSRLHIFNADNSPPKVTVVEEYEGGKDHEVKVIHLESKQYRINEVAGCCPIIPTKPPVLRTQISEYHKKHLASYTFAKQNT